MLEEIKEKIEGERASRGAPGKMKVDTHKKVWVSTFLVVRLRKGGKKEMSRKGQPHRKWTKEEKMVFVRMHIEEHKSLHQIERKEGVSNGLVAAWVKRYLEEGEEGLEAKKGNPYAGFMVPPLFIEAGRAS